MASVVQDITPVGSLLVNVGPAQNVVTQLIAPSANLYGVVVRTMSINLIPASGVGAINIFADMSAPANISDGTKRIVTSLNSSSAITQVWPKQVQLAPGMGMWAGGNQTAQSVSMTYDLLPMADPVTPPGGTTLPGSVVSYAGAVAPPGWLLCDGSAVSRSTYSALFAVVGTTFGSGDGSTTFGLPDLRGRTVFGKDNMGGTAANRVTSGVTGIAATTLGAAGGHQDLQQHTHNFATNSSGGGGPVADFYLGDIYTTKPYGGGGAVFSMANVGTGNAANMPPALILNYIIKT